MQTPWAGGARLAFVLWLVAHPAAAQLASFKTADLQLVYFQGTET
jgi:hypothetical protein